MSSGLVASMALPAQAVTSGPPEVSGPQTASIPLAGGAQQAQTAGSSAFFTSPETGLLATPPGLALEDGTVSAPAAATLDFDQTGFVAVPALGGRVSPPVPVDLGLRTLRTTPSTSESGLRAPQARPAAQDDADDERSVAPAPAKPAVTRKEARKARTTTTTKKAEAHTPASGVVTGARASGLGASAVSIASRYLGVPYRFGGSSPRGFDCSGLIQYVYAQLGHKLPRTAAAQAAAVRHIPRSQARPGDLVLFQGGGHIGLYVGDGKMLDAPRRGQVVQIRKIYSSNVSFGRVA